MTIKKIIILLTLLFVLDSFGQKKDSLTKAFADTYLFTKKNSINLEAFGHGLWYSLSYERILINNYHYKIAGQIGVAVYPYSFYTAIWVPVSINYLRSFGLKRNHHIELGVGHVIDKDIGLSSQTFFTAKVGYRHQNPNGRWIFKILFTPLYEYDRKNVKSITQPSINNTIQSNNPYLSGALSIGYTF